MYMYQSYQKSKTYFEKDTRNFKEVSKKIGSLWLKDRSALMQFIFSGVNNYFS